MKKGMKIFAFIASCLALMLSAFSSLIFNFKMVSAIPEEVDSEITSIQVRSVNVEGSDENYIVIVDNQIEISFAPENTKEVENYTAPNNVKIYTDETTNILLSDIIVADSYWCINRWNSQGVMFPISWANYLTYNASSIYMIEVLKDASYPNNKSQKVVNHENRKFINLNYNSGNIVESYDWAEDREYEKGDTELEIYGAQLRGDASGYYVDLRCHLYEDEPITKYVNLRSVLRSAYENIFLYVKSSVEGEEFTGKSLMEIASSGTGVINKWDGTYAFMFTLTPSEFDEYNGCTVHHIQVKKDCELIYQNKICKVASPVTLINPEETYDKPSSKYICVDLTPPVNPEPLEEPISLYGSQVRSEIETEGPNPHEWYYIDFLSELFDGKGEFEYEDLSEINAYSNIRIYTDKDNYVTLGEATSMREGVQCRWDKNFLFALSKEEFEIYNGASIYMIEVVKGCEIYVDRALANIDKNYTFVNPHYNDSSFKFKNFDFSMDASDLTNFGEINIVGVHNRSDNTRRGEPDCERWLMFLLDDHIYTLSRSVAAWIEKLNFLDNVLIYQTENSEPITLKSIYNKASGADVRKFGESNMFGVTISNEIENDTYKYDGPHMHSMVILAGTQLPSIEDNNEGYRVIKDKTLLTNDDYGLSGPIPNTKDDNGDPRLYEEWNLNWNVIRCFVSFTVVGIDGLSYPEISLQKGQRVSLSDYAVDGYDLVATTSEGEKIYQSIIGVDRNLNVILTYTPINPQQEPNWNLILPLSIGGGVLLIGGAAALTIILIRKKGKVRNEK